MIALGLDLLAVSLVCRNGTSGTLHVKGMLRGGNYLGLNWIGDGIEHAVVELSMYKNWDIAILIVKDEHKSYRDTSLANVIRGRWAVTVLQH